MGSPIPSHSIRNDLRVDNSRTYVGHTTLAQTVILNNQTYTVRLYVPEAVNIDVNDPALKQQMLGTIKKMLDFATAYNMGKESVKGGTVVGLSLSRDGKSVTKRTDGARKEERTKDIEQSLTKKRDKHEAKVTQDADPENRSRAKVDAIDRIIERRRPPIDDLEESEDDSDRVSFDDSSDEERVSFDEASDSEETEPIESIELNKPKKSKRRKDKFELNLQEEPEEL